MKIEPKFTGELSITGVGRVGTYEAAVRGRRCRARSYWAIEEGLGYIKITTGPGWEERTSRIEREDLGKFKTKTAAIQFLCECAKEQGLTMKGDLDGYPRLCLNPVPA